MGIAPGTDLMALCPCLSSSVGTGQLPFGGWSLANPGQSPQKERPRRGHSSNGAFLGFDTKQRTKEKIFA